MNKLASLDALAIGVNTIDVLVRLPDHYTVGEKCPVHDMVVQGGGAAANAACVLAALGWRTGFIARLSDDMFSTISRAEFKRCGVIDDFFILDPDASPVAAIVQVDPKTGERTIFYMANRYKFLTAADIPFDVVRQTKLVLVDGFERDAAPVILEAVRETGGHSVVDIEGGDSEKAFRLLELGTDCILPIGVARTLTGEETAERVLHRLAEKTAAQLIVTDGVLGSWALTEDGVLHQPAFAVAAVDTTGCGDAFHGAYGGGLLGGLPLRVRMELAAWVASQVALGLGGRSNLPTRDSLRKMGWSMFSPELRNCLMSPPWNSAPLQISTCDRAV